MLTMSARLDDLGPEDWSATETQARACVSSTASHTLRLASSVMDDDDEENARAMTKTKRKNNKETLGRVEDLCYRHETDKVLRHVE